MIVVFAVVVLLLASVHWCRICRCLALIVGPQVQRKIPREDPISICIQWFTTTDRSNLAADWATAGGGNTTEDDRHHLIKGGPEDTQARGESIDDHARGTTHGTGRAGNREIVNRSEERRVGKEC